MPGYQPIYTEYTKPANIMLRLTLEDTRFLAQRVKEALDKNTGVNLVFLNWNGAFSITYSQEKGQQLKCIAFHKSGIRVESSMRGYNGPWSHLELAYPMDSLVDMEKFAQKAQRFKPKTEQKGLF